VKGKRTNKPRPEGLVVCRFFFGFFWFFVGALVAVVGGGVGVAVVGGGVGVG